MTCRAKKKNNQTPRQGEEKRGKERREETD